MQNKLVGFFISTCVLAASLAAQDQGKKEVIVKSVDTPGHQGFVHIEKDDGKTELVPVTFLGVETTPASGALASQLGLPGDTGLVVTHVAEDSPAAAVLKQHDLLTKFDDQILIDTRQLRVLVRSHKEGDEVTLTLFRAGKEQTQKVKLGKKEVSKMIGMDDRPGPDQFFRAFRDGDLPDEMPLRELPGLAREDVDKVMRMIGRDHNTWFATPPVRVFSYGHGKGSTILNLADGNFAFSDDNGSVEVNATNGKRELTVKNAKGDATFKGPINNEADRKKLPPEVVARLDKIEKMDVGYEAGDDFEQGATAIKPPDKTKISLTPALREIGRPNPPF